MPKKIKSVVLACSFERRAPCSANLNQPATRFSRYRLILFYQYSIYQSRPTVEYYHKNVRRSARCSPSFFSPTLMSNSLKDFLPCRMFCKTKSSKASESSIPSSVVFKIPSLTREVLASGKQRSVMIFLEKNEFLKGPRVQFSNGFSGL